MAHEVRDLGVGLPALVAAVGLLAGVDALVLRQGGAVAEGLAAVAALVGLLAGVDALVLRQRGAVAEGLPALVALVGLLSGVNGLVLGEGRRVEEGLPALAALVRPLPRVDLAVARHVRHLRVGLAALLALEGLLARVAALVLDERRALREGLAALLARVGLLARVDALVLRERRALAEGLPAHGARVGLLAGVDDVVLDEVGAVAEGLPAGVALVRLLPGVAPLVDQEVRLVKEGPLADGTAERPRPGALTALRARGCSGASRARRSARAIPSKASLGDKKGCRGNVPAVPFPGVSRSEARGALSEPFRALSPRRRRLRPSSRLGAPICKPVRKGMIPVPQARGRGGPRRGLFQGRLPGPGKRRAGTRSAWPGKRRGADGKPFSLGKTKNKTLWLSINSKREGSGEREPGLPSGRPEFQSQLGDPGQVTSAQLSSEPLETTLTINSAFKREKGRGWVICPGGAARKHLRPDQNPGPAQPPTCPSSPFPPLLGSWLSPWGPSAHVAKLPRGPRTPGLLCPLRAS
uniref:Uncharacterized protein n=1 Tax=Monodelphis domestica TaxID=13616 RepID=A0A5F8GT98_MONDO